MAALAMLRLARLAEAAVFPLQIRRLLGELTEDIAAGIDDGSIQRMASGAVSRIIHLSTLNGGESDVISHRTLKRIREAPINPSVRRGRAGVDHVVAREGRRRAKARGVNLVAERT